MELEVHAVYYRRELMIIVFNIHTVTPAAPTNPKAAVLMQANDSLSHNYSVLFLNWNKPQNVDQFDLQYYYVQATIPQHSRPFYTQNVTSTEVLIRMDSEVPIASKDMKISISAVSRCSEVQGLPAVMTFAESGETE